MTAAAHSLAAHTVAIAGTQMPPSFDGGDNLFLFNLVVMTAAMFLGTMSAGMWLRLVWLQRFFDHPKDPVSVFRVILTLASFGLAMLCGAEAMNLWGWDPSDPILTARLLMAKRWLDPLAVLFTLAALAFAMLARPGLEHQLRKAPLPVDMWSRWPTLARAAGVIVACFVAALAAVVLR